MIQAIKRRAAITIAIGMSLLMFTTAPSFAQSVADAARRERERKKEKAREMHVYTNEDLAKPQILVPADQARMITRKNGMADPLEASVPLAQPAAVPPAQPATETKAKQTSLPAELADTAAFSEPGKHSSFPSASVTTQVQRAKAGAEKVAAPTVVLPAKVGVEAWVRPTPQTTSKKAQIPQPATNLPLQMQAAPVRTSMQVALAIEAVGSTSNVTPAGTSSPATATARQVGREALNPSNPLGPLANEAGITPVRSSLSERTVVQPLTPIQPQEITVRAVPERKQPLAVAGSTIQVRAGDSLWKLAESHLGSGERWTELAKLNPQFRDPSLIHPGDEVQMPAAEAQHVKKIMIRVGDTLWSVAQAEFGRSLAVACITHANPQLQSADVIRVGQTLIMPETCAVSR